MGKTNQKNLHVILNKIQKTKISNKKSHQMRQVVLLSACGDSESIGSEEPKKAKTQ